MFEKSKSTLKKKLQMVSFILSSEKKETKKMLEIYLKQAKGEATPEELEKANSQFKMILKTAGLGVFLVLPLAPITFPLIIYLGKKLNVQILPNSYHQALEDEKKKEV
jgi:hypothetical protein